MFEKYSKRGSDLYFFVTEEEDQEEELCILVVGFNQKCLSWHFKIISHSVHISEKNAKYLINVYILQPKT